jgi:NAD(P)-dependent dehydrogenase (short-subunit alcohol dehydrogenase family)
VIKTSLTNFDKPLNVAVIGASGGIGNAFTDLLTAQDKVKTVHALSRSGASFDHPKIKNGIIDITDEQSVASAAAGIETGLDLIILAAGFLHDEETLPEKSLRDIDINNFEKVFARNTFGPALVAKHFLPLILKERKSVFAALSARVGSIGDNHLGGWYAYRASKAALNMLLRCCAIETARRYKHAAIIGLHPGTVDTGLSKPFQGNVKPEKLFTPRQSAAYLLNVINTVTPEDSGAVFAWDGQRIEY